MTVMFEEQQTGTPLPAAASSVLPAPDTVPATACSTAQQAASNTPQEDQNVGAEDSCELWSERKTRFLIAGYKERKPLLGKKGGFR